MESSRKLRKQKIEQINNSAHRKLNICSQSIVFFLIMIRLWFPPALNTPFEPENKNKKKGKGRGGKKMKTNVNVKEKR